MDSIAGSARAIYLRRGWWMVAAVLLLAFACGGSSRGQGLGDAVAQLAALPLLGWAVLVLVEKPRRLRAGTLLLALLPVMVLAALQLPIPMELWEVPHAREQLRRDLALAGIAPEPHWTLAPFASERALWSVLPALAVFLGSLAVEPIQLRRLLLLVVLLAAASLVLGVLQMALPRDSLLNPYPRWAPAFNGVFENPNHQGTMLALAATIVASLHWTGRDAAGLLHSGTAAWTGLGVVLLLAIPLTGSRAAVGLGVLGVSAAFAARAWRKRGIPWPRRRVLLLLGGGAAALLVAAAFAWSGISGSVRWQLIEATAAMALDHAPLGAGAGTFVAWFDQAAPAHLVQWEYFNHAHDEYVQWWFELGVAGIACVIAVVAVLVAQRPRLAQRPGTFGIALAGWLGCVLLMLHSFLEYVLRTPALMVVAGLLAAAMIAGAPQTRRFRSSSLAAR